MQSEPTPSGPSVSSPAVAGLSSVPLFHAAWLFAAGIALMQVVWLRPSVVLIALPPIAVLCCIAAFRAQRLVWLPVAVLWCLLGAWCAEMEPHPGPAPDVAALSDGLLRDVEGTITDAAPLRTEAVENVEESASEGPSQRIDLRVSSIETVDDAMDAQTAAVGGVRLTVRWPQEVRAVVPAGLPLRGTSARSRRACFRLKSIAILARGAARIICSIRASLLQLQSSIERVERLGTGARQLAGLPHRRVAARHQRASAGTACDHAAYTRPLRLSDDDAVMLAAMTTGDRTYLTHSLRVGFERTGSFHMLVVSGFHLAILAGCVFWIARRLRLPRIPATLVTIGASYGFALFTGFATPVQRSLWMISLYLLGRLVYRERSALNTIGFASLCLLAVSPRSLFDSGLQMTLLAVISIAGVAAPLLQGTVHPYLTSDARPSSHGDRHQAGAVPGSISRHTAHDSNAPSASGVRKCRLAGLSLDGALCSALR